MQTSKFKKLKKSIKQAIKHSLLKQTGSEEGSRACECNGGESDCECQECSC